MPAARVDWRRALPDELAQGTIERVLARSELELGVEFLLGLLALERTALSHQAA